MDLHQRATLEISRRSALRLLGLAGAGGLSAFLAACSGGLGSLGGGSSGGGAPVGGGLPMAAGETVGNGPVRVALLVPLTGEAAITSVGTSLANAAKLAMNFIAQSANNSQNITLVIKDTGTSAVGATQRTSEAVAEGAKLILGPLLAEQVTAAGAVARTAGIPLIGFSNNTGAASPGVYLLNVLPEAEVRRSLAYAQAQGKRAFAAIVPTTAAGRIQEGAFRQAAADLGLTARAVYTFTTQAEAEAAVTQAAPFLRDGSIDALFIPDGSTATSFASFLETAGVSRGPALIIGSSAWDDVGGVTQTPYLVGAVYPALNETGFSSLVPEYQATYGGIPHRFSTLAYTSVLLANSPSLAMAPVPYDRAELTRASGFTGEDGQFRLLADGRSEFALVIKQVQLGGAIQAEGPRI